MTDTKHTPTPWKVSAKKSRTITGNGERIAVMHNLPRGSNNFQNSLARANAAHIVKCVNMHDELVEALKFIASSNMTNPYDFKQVANEALKKAGAL